MNKYKGDLVRFSPGTRSVWVPLQVLKLPPTVQQHKLLYLHVTVWMVCLYFELRTGLGCHPAFTL